MLIGKLFSMFTRLLFADGFITSTVTVWATLIYLLTLVAETDFAYKIYFISLQAESDTGKFLFNCAVPASPYEMSIGH